jgi:hypothetical protein
MKKLLIVIVGILLILDSCKKSEPILPVNSISATIGGVNMNFVAKASYLNRPTIYYQLRISGNTHSDTAYIFMAFSNLTDSVSITKGTYTPDSRPVAFDATYYAPPFQGYSKVYLQSPSVVQPLKATITSISSTNVQGTFSGMLVNINYGGSTIAITNGRFNVNIN